MHAGEIGRWGEVWKRVGTRLPEDFVEFIGKYGSGEICRWLWVHNPFASPEGEAFVPSMLATLGAFRELKASHPETIPYPLHYEPNGLIPWGTSIDGDAFCWLSSGLPSQGPVVVICRHAEPERHEVGMVPFLDGLLTGSIRSNAWPTDVVEILFAPSSRAG